LRQDQWVLQVLRARVAPEAAARECNHHCPLLEVKIQMLDVVLKVYNRVGALIHHRASGV
jgi:hypothetical protein